ncbi:hypothetical protein [Nocardia ignorata]|uniref:Uncharacterized protein n=1 Tax=Nocardia ignorata TaxID=145285 RepID=A0A4R6PUT5_NOCIG|nr:hypothetical protein [Nocardia ignorata]TDP42681.1 hypothetical protein DFR75_1011795 [Nocardia ignorata]
MGEGFLDKSGAEPGRSTPYRPPEPARWPTRPQPEPLLFSHEVRAANVERERVQRLLRESAAGPDYSSSSARKIGTVAIVGIAALIGGGYLLSRPSNPDPVIASCVRTEKNGSQTVVADSNCSSSGVGSFRGSSTWPQYQYYYGGNTTIGKPPSGGTTIKPSNVEIKTKSGTVIQRGGLGRGGGSGS